ncbi:hypothetical protein CDAR_490341 [Caerostris darwini]|uniref:Uncharacterized protein n=1 Tax=Caerostris darwini TaxID=1538125 RepID=A0AAV4R605_9ARAC|nr:hypothetical protein CDAR_490341 [Caerostris darwini]
MSSNIIYQLSVPLQAALLTRQYKNMREKRVVSLHPILALNENMHSAHLHAISPRNLKRKTRSCISRMHLPFLRAQRGLFCGCILLYAPFPAQRRKCAELIRFSGYIKSCIKRSPKSLFCR